MTKAALIVCMRQERRTQLARTKAASDRSSRRKTDADGAFGGLDLDFSTSPTVWKFLSDNAFFRGLMGLLALASLMLVPLK